MSSERLPNPPPHLGQDVTRSSSVSPHRDRLGKIQTIAVNDRLNEIIASLRRLQSEAGLKTRYHLIVETDEASIRHATPSRGGAPENENRASYNVDITTKILHSPTISFRRQGERHRKLAHNLVCAISELSFLSLRSAPSQQPNNITTLLSEPRRPIATLYQSEDDGSIDEELFNIEPFAVPLWFPFTETEYRNGLPFSSSNPLLISEDTASKFDSLSNDDVSNLYRTFFEVLHSYAKRKKRDYKQGKLKYSMFTPPWLRTRLVVSGNVCEMPKLAIQDQREQRNRQGYKRMAWIMAAFYEKETCFGKYVLDYLLDKLPLFREEWYERNGNRKYATPIQRALAGSSHKRVARRVSPGNRKVRRRLDVTEAPESPTGVATPLRYNPDQLDYHQNSGTISKRHINRRDELGKPIENAVTTRSFANQRASSESANKPMEGGVTAPAEHQTGVSTSQSKENSAFDRLQQNPNHQPDVTKNSRVRFNDICDKAGESSHLLNGGAPVIALSSGSSENRPSTTKKRANRPLHEITRTIVDEPKKRNRSIERRGQKGSAIDRKSRSVPKARLAQGQKQSFMSIHGVKFNLSGDDSSQSNELETRAKTFKNAEGKTSAENEYAQNRIHPIVCAARSQCIFRDSADAQDPASITGRCKECSKHLHDLCGGGEEGDMMCPSCKNG